MYGSKRKSNFSASSLAIVTDAAAIVWPMARCKRKVIQTRNYSCYHASRVSYAAACASEMSAALRHAKSAEPTQ
jgi:hypothetical protein